MKKLIVIMFVLVSCDKEKPLVARYDNDPNDGYYLELTSYKGVNTQEWKVDSTEIQVITPLTQKDILKLTNLLKND